MGGQPARIGRLPEQYFGALLTRVAAQAVVEGEPLIDLGRGNPETGPPLHVVEALTEAAHRSDVHGYSPFRGLPELREALAERYRTHYASSSTLIPRWRSCREQRPRSSSLRSRSQTKGKPSFCPIR